MFGAAGEEPATRAAGAGSSTDAAAIALDDDGDMHILLDMGIWVGVKCV